MGRLAGVRAVAANRVLLRSELAWLGSIAGEAAYAVVLAVYAYREGGAAAVGVVWLARTIPSAAAAPLVALVADRYRRERVLLGANAVRAAATVATIAAVAADLPLLAFGLSVLVAIVSTVFWPAQAALLPALARTPGELTAANTLSTALESLGGFVGPVVCAAVLAAAGVEAAFVAVAVVFVAAALPLLRVRTAGAARPDERGSVLRELAGGVRAVAETGDLRLLVGVMGAWALIEGALTVLVVVAALELLELGESGVGVLTAAIGVGGIVGAAVAVAFVTERSLDRALAAGALVFGLPIALLALPGGVWPAVALLVLLGVGGVVLDTSLLTLLQRAAPDEVQARVFGLVEALWVAGIGVGAATVPLALELLGDRVTLVLAGLLLPALMVGARARVAGLVPPPSADLDLLRGVPFLGVLPLPALEGLAAAVERVTVPAGTPVITLGEAGDRFYVVSDGALSVEAPGADRRLVGPGDSFGEIALLHDVPRTATVTAETHAELLALDREDFLAAVRGNPVASSRAAAVARSRLRVSGPAYSSSSTSSVPPAT